MTRRGTRVSTLQGTNVLPDNLLYLSLFSFFATDNESVCMSSTNDFAPRLSNITQHDSPRGS